MAVFIKTRNLHLLSYTEYHLLRSNIAGNARLYRLQNLIQLFPDLLGRLLAICALHKIGQRTFVDLPVVHILAM